MNRPFVVLETTAGNLTQIGNGSKTNLLFPGMRDYRVGDELTVLSNTGSVEKTTITRVSFPAIPNLSAAELAELNTVPGFSALNALRQSNPEVLTEIRVTRVEFELRT